MSIRAKLNVSMTDADVIKRMCERRGWTQFQHDKNRNQVSFRVNTSYDGRVTVDLDTGKVGLRLDRNSEARMQSTIVGSDVRCDDGTIQQQIDDMLAINYEEASVIVGAERTGRRWTEGLTSEGYSWIRVQEPLNKASNLEELLT